MSRRTLRTALVVKVIGAPVSRTTRRPFSRFPGVRPELRTSNAMSYPVKTTKEETVQTAAAKPSANGSSPST